MVSDVEQVDAENVWLLLAPTTLFNMLPSSSG
jgi:hypothetical protein